MYMYVYQFIICYLRLFASLQLVVSLSLWNMCITFTQLAGCPDILAVPVHCDSGFAEHPDCPVQQEL